MVYKKYGQCYVFLEVIKMPRKKRKERVLSIESNWGHFNWKPGEYFLIRAVLYDKNLIENFYGLLGDDCDISLYEVFLVLDLKTLDDQLDNSPENIEGIKRKFKEFNLEIPEKR